MGGEKHRIVHKKGMFARPEYFVMPQSVVDDPRWPFEDGEEIEIEIDEVHSRVVLKKKNKAVE